MEFKTLVIGDKPWVRALLEKADCRGCEYAFSCIVMWAGTYRLRAAQADGFLLVRSDYKETPGYLFPAGEGDLRAVVERLLSLSAREGHPLFFYSMTAENRAQLEALFPGRFQYEENRDAAEYLYAAQSLITLAGKKLHAKRNHIHRFEESHPGWHFEEIGPHNIDDCRKMNDEWCVRYGCEQNDGLRAEACAVDVAFRYFFDFPLQGGLLRDGGGRVVAYAMGERLNSDTYNVRIEKAFHDIQGAYALINREFSARFCREVAYINREDDTGDEGLRRAKQSYRPALLLEKYTALERG